MKAVVVGATGAIGEHVVGQLLINPAWSEVVAVGRRAMTVPAEYKPEDFKAKLEQATINMDSLKTEATGAFQGADSVFCCLGTTRKAAGSADAFLKVDYDYVKSTAEAAKEAGVKHFALVTAQGAKADAWANKWGMFHGLLYIQTKGRAEEVVKAQEFPSVVIWRPGMLDRGDKTRSLEKMFHFLNKIPVAGVAKLMVDTASDPNRPKLAVFEMKEMQSALKERRLCKPDNQ